MGSKKHTARIGRQRSGLVYLAATVVLCVTAATVSWFLSSGVPLALRDVDPVAVPVTAPATEVEANYSMSANLTVKFSPVLPLIVPEQSGTVTSVDFASGDTVDDGTVLYSVNDRPVTAYAGSAVLYRELKKGDIGEDVTQAQIILGSLLPEYSVWVDGEFGPNTLAAVKAWEKQNGIAKPTGVFSPAWFVRLPSSPYVVDAVKIQEGQPALAAGAELATGLSQPTKASVSFEEESEAPLGAYEMMVSGKPLAVSHTEDGWSVDELDVAAKIVSRPSEGNSSTASGNLRLIDAESRTSIPASSIITDGDLTCVAVKLPGDTAFTVVAAEVIESTTDGSVLIDSTINGGDEVLMNPVAILDEPRCP